VRMSSLDALQRPSSRWLGRLSGKGVLRPLQDSASGYSEERLRRASGVGGLGGSKRPAACMEATGTSFCTVCGDPCSSPEGTRGHRAVGKARVTGGGRAGVRCCGCWERNINKELELF
uniref:Uncharacterized protein n=1 Tax=Cebus imitator TaxID=2715852 RepID=A0A2K5SDK6_CEBIM